ncbi:Kunitz/Bovine pancreatic trypsin inhibitor domain protein, partial [Ostertagia ostertagi]
LLTGRYLQRAVEERILQGQNYKVRPQLSVPPGKGLVIQMITARYGFSMRQRRCVRFTYSGCRGNRNRFKTMKECKKKCRY